ncbi:hypothetical protein Sango_0152600 [Sesamum angolense]|uniref:Uncharacterized protein n=1 Tax=Sesamum angolense TaxID=2727404 RepID=A0AAE2C6G9_9LAMI|nr:hypothetical protein Sango_0152600 [Sesamum angolense]
MRKSPLKLGRNSFKKPTRSRRICRILETHSRNRQEVEKYVERNLSESVCEGNPFPHGEDVESDDDAALVNDNFFERIDVALDQLRKKDKESGGRMTKVDDDQETGFRWFMRRGSRNCCWGKFWGLDFVDKPDSNGEPVEFLPIEVRPLKLAEDLRELNQFLDCIFCHLDCISVYLCLPLGARL